jgi:hypothetical protein
VSMGEGGLDSRGDRTATVGAPAAGGSPDSVRELLLQVEKTLTVRKLYPPHAGPYQESMAALDRKLWRALDGEPFTVSVGADRLALGGDVLIERPERDDCFFFPLYRDGLRELTFSPEVEPREVEALLSAFEAERARKLSPEEDLVAYLWRCDLYGIRFSAVDGIGDEEGEPGEALPGEDYRALVSDLVAKIRDPAPPVTGQSYAFVLDADVRLALTDLRYDATTTHRAFTENPTVFRLTREQATALRTEVAREDEADLLARFVTILLAMAVDPGRTADVGHVLRVVKQLLGSLWQVGEHAALVDTLQRLQKASHGAPDGATRVALVELLRGFFTPDRLSDLFHLVGGVDGLPLPAARQLWDLAGEEAWGPLLDFLQGLPDGELAAEVRRYLRTRIASSPDLLRAALAETRAERVLTALSLLDPRVEGLFVRELLPLARHGHEAVRLKAVAAAGRLPGPEAKAALWRAFDADTVYQVRLLAFRLLAASDRPALVERLCALVHEPTFAERPLWERRKAAQMLAEAMGEDAAPLLARWIPRRRFFLGRSDMETAALAIDLLRECGRAGRDALGSLAAGRGRIARLAAQALAGGSVT